MALLVIGVLFWSGLHLLPSAGISVRTILIERLGSAYQGLFALGIISCVVLMVLGWRSAPPTVVYTPPAWGSLAANVLVFLALLLFAASAMATNIKRIIRHPQLAGVATWGVAHLLGNGELRSLVLFGGLALWSVAAMVFINRRDGAREEPQPQPLSDEWKPLAAALVGFVVLYVVHPYISGVPATPHLSP
ncbi:MAG: NnrU family protein [Myxococcota bacterium]|jgi:uncharacterized membrane protein|nr:NnrU protein [Deltaproteobacteria bacterium]MCP4245331.1 NnrU protein [bacterium]MDP6242268.1 NnrU family protein [Myxococcota bacterium]MDP7434182.1 NnrU family protein [Myxococcota bacterium]